MIDSGKIRQILAIAIIAAILAIAGAIALKAYRGMRSGPVLPSLPKNIDVSLKKIHYTETKDGVKKWDLVADKAEFDRVGDVVRLAGIRLEVAAGGKTGDIVLTSDRGDYFTKSKNVDLVGNVTAKSGSGMEFVTDRASYLAAKSLIRTVDPVRFSDGSMKVQGTGMEFFVETKTLKILSKVTADFVPGTILP
jgi:lipopolysaccharide export system protein LptC